MVTVVYTEIDPAEVLNLTSPRYLPEIEATWRGLRPWHDRCYEPLRDMIEKYYVDQFDRRTGHFARLLESMAVEGVRNPVMLTAGGLIFRRDSEVPPAWRSRDPLIISEYLGGSRLWAAEKLGIAVPAIVNDYTDTVSGEILPFSGKAIADRFRDKPGRVDRRPDGAVVICDPVFAHLPASLRMSVPLQSQIRMQIVNEIRHAVSAWLQDKEGVAA